MWGTLPESLRLKTCWRAMMFDPSETPRLFGLPPGLDFPRALVTGLKARLTGRSPEAMARVTLIVNTQRMARRLTQIFAQEGPGFLPRILQITHLDSLLPTAPLPQAASALRRRLELIELVSGLLDAGDPMAPRASLFGLSDSLAKLFDEMQGEGVEVSDILKLDVTDQSGHWEKALRFIAIADSYMDQTRGAPDPEARQRALINHLTAEWQARPPANPIILAGSTGSRGTTALLMEAVAGLPQGALVLPGFDADLPARVWQLLDTDAGGRLPPEDHPQYRFRHLMRRLELAPSDVAPWITAPPPSPARNRLVSLSLRPAPVTHAWLQEGPKLTGLEEACADITLLEAPTPRQEALAIAMRLRKAAAAGQKAALITPDRMLTRQVTAALDRWNILPDDSAGTPLQLTAPGRFLRHTAALLVHPLDAEGLMTLLKHPLTHSGAGRGDHGLFVQRLEAAIRAEGLPYPDAASLMARAETAMGPKDAEEGPFRLWAAWVAQTFTGLTEKGDRRLEAWVSAHRRLSEKIAAGVGSTDPGELWKQKAGEKALAAMEALAEEAPHGGTMTAAEYGDLVGALLSQEEVRDRDAPHPDIMIWGTLEARVQGADLVILGGLNEGTWPEAPQPDPWLNRQMRAAAGLLLPDRRIGLSAHDYQQAIAAPEVWLSRAIRSDDAETVPSRWLNRLGNLMRGLPQPEGKAAWDAMKERGVYWLSQAKALERIDPVQPAPRPSPRPPRDARFERLSVTEIKRLIRDPYAIYARHSLQLRPLNPLMQYPDALLRGTILHEIMEEFVKAAADDPTLLNRTCLMQTTERVLAARVPWPAARAMWKARILRIANWFIQRETERQKEARPSFFEEDARAKHELSGLGVKIIGFADRIDLRPDGAALIYDYKTGTPPTRKVQQHFDKQLLIEAALLEEGAFERIGPRDVAGALYIGLGSSPSEVFAPLQEEPPAKVLADLRSLIEAYLSEDQGFTSRRAVQTEEEAGDYDQLARFGEWDGTTLPEPTRLRR